MLVVVDIEAKNMYASIKTVGDLRDRWRQLLGFLAHEGRVGRVLGDALQWELLLERHLFVLLVRIDSNLHVT